MAAGRDLPMAPQWLLHGTFVLYVFFTDQSSDSATRVGVRPVRVNEI